MKSIIKLPGLLNGSLDLAAINQQLKTQTAQLDWSQVETVTDSELDLLLAGLDLGDDLEVIGHQTASEIVSEQLIAWSQKPKHLPEKPIIPEPATKQPQVWEPSIIPHPYQIRAELETAIIKDLLGPAGGETEEVREDRVSDRYLVGMLAPQKRQREPEEATELQDTLETPGETSSQDGQGETTTPPNNTMFPSSLGLTFCVDGTVETILLKASWGKYDKVDGEEEEEEPTEKIRIWKRTPIEKTQEITLRAAKEIHWVPDREQAPDVYVQGKIRQLDESHWIVTLFLVNSQTEPKKLRDSAWLFQAQLQVTASIPGTPIFRRQPTSQLLSSLDPETAAEKQAMAMLYRQQVEFAVGHGVSVGVATDSQDPQKAISITTSFIPRFEVPKTSPPNAEEIPLLQDLVLDMKELTNFQPQHLQPLVTAYQDWITSQKQKLKAPEAKLQGYEQSAQAALQQCQQTLIRIQAGIDTLSHNPQAAEAFKFMNQAMAQQRLHSLYAEKRRRGEATTLEALDIKKHRSWYPFQLAFILLNIPSLTDLHHPERSNPSTAITDLLWFPTGGGKTEAYLGVAAYTMGIRRLQGVVGDRDPAGVTILMRYTLRLLTLQQFQRATTLICACEAIRRQDEQKWGKEPFRIGLWVGENSTPNYTSNSEEFIKQIKGQNSTFRGGSPHQLTNCPWCGSLIDPGRDIEVRNFEKKEGRTLIKCSNLAENCLFSQGEGLPVLVVDEEIYRRLPTLLIATVDKFAQMPWKGAVQMLFGEVNGYCERHGFRSPDLEDNDHHKANSYLGPAKTIPHLKLRPPDLIIQDELHLISGPLGSLVGLYETAIQSLSTWEVNGQIVMPKIIASTATIKQAKTQVKQLFAQKLQVFPPQGIDIQDNFFSRQREPSLANPGRLYLGICAQGRRVKAAIIRVYIAAMAAAQSLHEKYGEAVDPWLTLVGYFNSLRELGGTRRLVDDDITIRLGRMEKRGLSNRYLKNIEELTSRKNSTEIPIILDRLETPFGPKTEKSKSRQSKNLEALDVVLATNMISVGVDVKRLGLMVVCGQPKNTAEYIQATSRVGRSYPGLVITIYNWARPRDLSHYERFEHYHATFYQHVEALSVTPFATGALYRGLSGLLVALLRLKGEEFSKNDSAGKITAEHPYLVWVKEAIAARVRITQGEAIAREILPKIREKLELWLKQAQNNLSGRTLTYKKTKGDTYIELLQPASGKAWQDFTCLNSLRNVEASINLIFSDQPPDDDLNRIPQPFSQK